jgi:hypothetical protein
MKIDIIRGARAWVGAYEADLASRIENALQALAKIEASFWGDWQSLLEWPGPEALKERFLSQLEMHHAREKRPDCSTIGCTAPRLGTPVHARIPTTGKLKVTENHGPRTYSLWLECRPVQVSQRYPINVCGRVAGT